MTTCNGIFEIKENTIPAAELLRRMNAEQLQSFGQSLYDDINFSGDNKSQMILKVVEFAYFNLTETKLPLAYNCPP